MKYVKMLGLAAVAAAALMAFVGSNTASATVLCKVQGEATAKKITGTTCPAGQAYGTNEPEEKGVAIKAQLVAGTKAKLKTEFKTVECEESAVSGETKNEGGEGKEITGPEGTLSFGKCNCEVTVVKAGTLSVGWIEKSHNGTLKSNGSKVETTCNTIFGSVHCIYVTENTDIGTLTGGAMAKLDANASIPRLQTNSLCSAQADWEAEYTVTSPEPLWVTGET